MNKLLLSNLMLFLFCGMTLGQVKIYVSESSGDDTENGKSWQTAYRTIDKALDRVGTNPGDYEIYIAQGLYTLEDNKDITGGRPNEYLISTDQNISLIGGYSRLIKGRDPIFDPTKYNAIFNTNDKDDQSNFRIKSDRSSLKLKNISILNARQGGNEDGVLLTMEGATNTTIEMDNVQIHEWEGGYGELGKGVIFVKNSEHTTINITNSLFERQLNRKGAGQFLVVNEGNRNVDITIDKSTFRNVRRSIGTAAALFMITLDPNRDQGMSSVTFTNSRFMNNKGPATVGQAPSVIKVSGLPKMLLDDNVFIGNEGGDSGVVNFLDSGELTVQNNLWQDNYAGHAGGAIFAKGRYPEKFTHIKNLFLVKNETFIANHAGKNGLGGRGGAIAVANGLVGAASTPKEIKIINSKFTDNFTTAYAGGAVFVNTSEPFTVENSVFCDNEANRWFTGNSGGNGGAIYAMGNSEFTVKNSTFNNNRAATQGGAIYTERKTARVEGCSYFNENKSTSHGGAIWSSSPLVVDKVYLESNTSQAAGGAIYFENVGGHEISNATFFNNKAHVGGGAIFANNSIDPVNNKAKIKLSDSYFIQNESKTNEGGAIKLYNYGLSANNSIFDNNKANGGGAIKFYNAGSQNLKLQDSKFKNNIAVGKANTDGGGAINLHTATSNDVKILNNIFVSNKAILKGGAISVNDYNVGVEIDELSGNTFYGNSVGGSLSNGDLVGGSTDNTAKEKRSDIFIWYGAAGLFYYVNIGNFNNNALQFEPTDTNYPDKGGLGYHLGTGNTHQTSNVEVTYNEFICNPLECAVKQPTPVSPIVISANGINTGKEDDYSFYTQVAINDNCRATSTEVAFTARSNRAARKDGTILDIKNGHVEDIVITYTLFVTNNLTSKVTETVHEINSTTASRVEDPANEISASSPRDIYKTYFLDVTSDLKPGYTYTYTITKVEVPSEGTFTYDEGKYKTVIDVDFCDSDKDGIPNYVESPTGDDPLLVDSDNDGTPDYKDPDTQGFVDNNGDGIDDNYDTDGDGQPNFLDIDSDNDGILDSVEAGSDPRIPRDTDGDGVLDYLDLDSDNDGINDVDEGNPNAVDANGDGMVDGPYGKNGLANSLENGDDTFGATTTAPKETRAGKPDYINIDSDDDGTPDSVDNTPYGAGSTPPQSQDPSQDKNGDGIIDTVEDSDGDGIPNVVDVDKTGGTDTDGDGIDDTADVDNNPGKPDRDGDGIIDSKDPDKDGDGIADVVDNNPIIFGEYVICEINPNTDSNNVKSTKIRISTLSRNTNDWSDSSSKLGAYLVLESSTKGFVLPRMTTSQIDMIGTDTTTGVEEGMIVFDTDANCLKMFYDKNNDGTMTWNCISTDRCNNSKK